ncbi:MAG: hypothetical protein P8X95_23410 [Anaerolineales bacterium]|jgi:hypothetical protein
MSTKKLALLFVVSLALILSACAPAQALPANPTLSPSELSPAVQAAIKQLSSATGVNVQDIQIISTEQVDWPDACLGLPNTGETCAQVVTPGFQVVLQVNGQKYEFRTDKQGNIVRQVP